MPKTALIDGDIVAYRCAASCEPTKIKIEREPVELAILRSDELVYRILNSAEAPEHRIFLGGDENFRKLLTPVYKANRTQERPRHLGAVRDFLVREWGAEICAGYEADDGIGIAATDETIICSIDKDVRQLPGEHYNFVREEFMVVDEDTASFNFWLSMLVGDVADNVRGVRGIGNVKARRHLSSYDPGQYFDCVRRLYESGEDFLLNYRLLRILRSEEEYQEIMEWIRENPFSEGERPEVTTVDERRDTEEVPVTDSQ